MKYLFTIIIIIFSIGTGSSQDNYINAIGMRGGNPTGVTYKHFVGRYSVIEGILGISFSYKDPSNKKLGVSLTGLYEYHFFLTEGFNAFAGGGISIGGGKNLIILNADVIGGLEYTFYNFPLNISLDYKPFYSPLNRKDIGIKGFGLTEFGVSVRYVLQ